MIVYLYHIIARDVIAKLCKEQISSPTNFKWMSQLRYYFEDGGVVVRMITTEVPYGYEYLGEHWSTGHHSTNGSMLSYASRSPPSSTWAELQRVRLVQARQRHVRI